MQRIMIKDLSEKKGEEVKIKAWVDTERNQGKMAFFDFRDVSGKVQGVVFGKPEVLEVAKTVRAEDVVEVTGVVNERNDKTAKEAAEKFKETGVKSSFVTDVEIEITDIKVISKSEIPFELNEDVNLDIFLDNQPYTLRSDKAKAVFKIQSEIAKSFREVLNENGFTEFQAPKIVGGDAEGGAGVYKVDYFGNPAGLATSPQLYKQIMVGVFERAFTVGNVFRAEKHSTSRHLNEYTSLDFEMGFIDSYKDVADMLTAVLRGVKKNLKENCAYEMELLGAEDILLPEEIPMMTLKEAQNLLEEKLGATNAVGEPDLEPEHERMLCDYAKNELRSDLIFITHYPVSKRPFYSMEDPNDPVYTSTFDALFKGVEIVSGGERRHEYENLVEGIKMKGLNPDDFEFYLQAFKTGLPPHGGIGLGLERLTQKIVGLDNVKRATLFPREINRIDKLINK